jgi:hypothetical protein
LRRYLHLLVFLFVCASAFAHDSEPINTEFAAPFQRGSGNIQFGFQYLRGAVDYEVGNIEFEYGFARRQQFSVVLPFARRDEPGHTYVRPGNVEVGYRLLLAGGNDRAFALSINPELELPIGDKRVAESAWEGGVALHLDTHPAKRWWTHTNFGYATNFANFNGKEKFLIGKFAAMYELSEPVRPVFEIVTQHEFVGDETLAAAVPEVIFAPNHKWEIKLGVPLGLNSASPDVGAQVEITWKFGHGR